MRLPQSAANKAPLSSTRYRPCRLHGRSFRRHRESEISLQSGTRGPCCTAPRNFLAPSRGQNAQVFLSSRQLRPVYTLSFKLFSRNFHRGLGAWIFLLSSLAMVGYVICRVNSKQYALPANLRRSGPLLARPPKIVPKCSHWRWGRTLVRQPGPESYGGERIGHHCRPVDHAYLAPQQYRRSAQRYDRPI